MMGHEDLKCCSSMFFLFLVAIVGLVAFAGLMAGLTLGLMSLGLVDLEVLSKSGRTQDRIHACPYNLFPFFFNVVFTCYTCLGCLKILWGFGVYMVLCFI